MTTKEQSREQTGVAGAIETGSPIRVTPAKAKSITSGSRAHYWVGAIEGCPLDSPTVGGVAFQKRVLTFRKNDRGQNEPNGSLPGSVLSLSTAQVKHLLECIEKTVIRTVTREDGELARAYRLTMTPTYVEDPGKDIPIARYLYMQKMPGNDRGAALPAVMFEG